MAERSLQWDHWRSFVAVVEEGSLSGAARRLGLTQPTVSRHVELLEAAVGAALFLRAPYGLRPNELAQELVPEARAMAAAAMSLERLASAPAEAERGIVRLAASYIVGTEILPSLLAPFLAAHPGIELELAVSDRNDDLLRREADVAVRMVRPTQAALVARRVGQVKLGLFAHRDYCARHGRPERPDDLAGHVLIGPDRDAAGIAALGRLGGVLTRRMVRFRCDSVVAQLAALRAGVGIGACQLALARGAPELVPVLPDAIAFELDCWLVMHEDLRGSRRMRMLFDHLGEHLPAAIIA